MGNLPIELVTQVLHYLRLDDIFVFRMVSRRWNQLFCSPDICNFVARRFWGRKVGLDTTPADWQQTLTKRAEHQYAWITGRAYSKAFYPIDVQSADGTIAAYAGGYIAWRLNDPITEIKLKSLLDGEVRTFFTEGRDAFTDIQLSQTMLAALTTHGYCYVWNFKSGLEGSFRLPSTPSTRTQNLVVDGETVAILFTNLIIIWDLESQMAREIRITGPLLHIFLCEANRSLIAVYAEDDNGEREGESDVVTRFVRMKYSLGVGAKMEELPFELGCGIGWSEDFCGPAIGLNRSTAVSLLFSTYNTASPKELGDAYMLMSYDETSDQVDIREYRRPIGNLLEVASRKTLTAAPGDILYFATRRLDSIGTSDLNDANMNRIPEISRIEPILVSSSATPTAHRRGFICYSFADDRYFGIINDKGLHLWSFDSSITLAGEDPKYREVRERFARERRDARKGKRGFRRDLILQGL